MPPTVLHIMTSLDPEYGGPTAAIVGLASAQAEAGSDVRVLATVRPGDKGSRADDLRAAGVTVETVGPTRGPIAWHPEIAPRVRSMLDGAAVVHIHAVWEHIQHVAARQAARARVPYIFRPCGMLDPWCLDQGRLKKRLYLALRLRRDLNGASAIHFTSTTERDLVRPLALRPPAVVEPNGVGFDEFEDEYLRGTFRARHPDLKGRPVVLFMSRVHPKKGLDLLVPAFASCGHDDAVLVVAGPGQDAYVESIRALAREHGVEGRVLLTGMLHGPDRIGALMDADLFALPSYQENFGVAVVEALAAGTPVVISDQVNIHDEITRAGVGEAVPTKIEPLARALGSWLGDDERRRRAGEAAGPFVRERYDWNRIAERWLVRYERLEAGRAPDPA